LITGLEHSHHGAKTGNNRTESLGTGTSSIATILVWWIIPNNKGQCVCVFVCVCEGGLMFNSMVTGFVAFKNLNDRTITN